MNIGRIHISAKILLQILIRTASSPGPNYMLIKTVSRKTPIKLLRGIGNGLIDIIQETQTMNAKAKISVGDDVWVVQKTKRSKGVVTKIAIKKAVVDIENEGSYRVPFSMLELR